VRKLALRKFWGLITQLSEDTDTLTVVEFLCIVLFYVVFVLIVLFYVLFVLIVLSYVMFVLIVLFYYCLC